MPSAVAAAACARAGGARRHACYVGLFKTVDGGRLWRQLDVDNPTAVVIASSNPRAIYQVPSDGENWPDLLSVLRKGGRKVRCRYSQNIGSTNWRIFNDLGWRRGWAAFAEGFGALTRSHPP
jgi:hypothetical protein